MDRFLPALSAAVGWPIATEQLALLQRFGDFLAAEALPAGGIGPNEADRIDERHLVDSLLFAAGWDRIDPPRRLVDLGSGVGLPGIPLAILWPASRVTLIDKGGRRTDLARRAVRILALSNVEVVQAEAATFLVEVPMGAGDLIVARGAAEPVDVIRWCASSIEQGTRLLIGGSSVALPHPVHPQESIRQVGSQVLDRPVWLRMIGP